MIVNLVRSSKWELIGLFIAGAAVAMGATFALWHYLEPRVSLNEARLYSFFLFILLSGGFGYWIAQRYAGRIERLHIGLKQIVNGNYEERIAIEGHHSFLQLYKQFNELAAIIEEKMKLLQHMGEERLQQSASNEAAVHEERKRLARDLHDTVSQQLFAIHMCASSLSKLQQVDASRAESVLEQLVQMSNLAQKQMRNFIAQLRPMELEGRTLQEALGKWFPDFCRQNNLQGELEWRISSTLSEAKEHQLFLIVQEGMANIVKHAKAQHCTLTISENERQVVMTLADDGAGFKVESVKRGSYGLSTMQERAQKLGGAAEIMSKLGSGTRVRITIPKL